MGKGPPRKFEIGARVRPTIGIYKLDVGTVIRTQDRLFGGGSLVRVNYVVEFEDSSIRCFYSTQLVAA